ncbi:expressed unknown protein [Seminavis robusta]|uniref:Uncharacterized protein n=1 Tax=Seminavis robusta TaxID=568900 RepID=A0A9N8H1E2_9STRA|nr:expressed unknown protein [Seminavis robusta]|eukprot:Sro3_g002020.1 n/a (72) ;mRNA; r:24455-24800
MQTKTARLPTRVGVGVAVHTFGSYATKTAPSHMFHVCVVIKLGSLINGLKPPLVLLNQPFRTAASPVPLQV